MSDLGSARKIVSITTSDSADIAPCRGFHCNVGGNVKFTDLNNNAVTLTVLAGVTYPYGAKRIWQTDTTATGIHALY